MTLAVLLLLLSFSRLPAVKLKSKSFGGAKMFNDHFFSRRVRILILTESGLFELSQIEDQFEKVRMKRFKTLMNIYYTLLVCVCVLWIYAFKFNRLYAYTKYIIRRNFCGY